MTVVKQVVTRASGGSESADWIRKTVFNEVLMAEGKGDYPGGSPPDLSTPKAMLKALEEMGIEGYEYTETIERKTSDSVSYARFTTVNLEKIIDVGAREKVFVGNHIVVQVKEKDDDRSD